MALIDELKERWESTLNQAHAAEVHSIELYAAAKDLSRAIAALQPPAQPHDELHDAPPATEENSGDDIEASGLQTEETTVSSSGGDDQGEAFAPPPGGVEESRDQPCTCHPDDAPLECMKRYAASECHAAYGAKYFPPPPAEDFTLLDPAVLKDESAPLIDTQTCEEVDPRVSWQQEEAEAEGYAPVVDAEPTTDLWQQGYNDKLNGYEPSLSEPDYLSGYEARALIEREQGEGSTARMFAEGMIADADRHQEDQRSIVEKIGGLFKREKEPA